MQTLIVNKMVIETRKGWKRPTILINDEFMTELRFLKETPQIGQTLQFKEALPNSQGFKTIIIKG